MPRNPLAAFDLATPESLARLRAAMAAETDPLAGPFPTARDLTDYSDDEGFAVPWPPRAGSVASPTTKQMTRLLAGEED